MFGKRGVANSSKSIDIDPEVWNGEGKGRALSGGAKRKMEVSVSPCCCTELGAVAMRTRSRSRSRSRCCSVQSSSSTGVDTYAESAADVDVASTAKKRSITASSIPCRKRDSLTGQLDEIVKEQPECSDIGGGKKLLESGIEGKGKVMLRKSGRLSGTRKEYHKVQDQESPTKRDSKRSAQTDNIGSNKKESAKRLTEIAEKLPIKSSGDSEESTGEKSLTLALENSPATNTTISRSLLTTDILKPDSRCIDGENLEKGGVDALPALDDLPSLWTSCGTQSIIVDSIEKAYALANNLDPMVPTISQELIKTDCETIWQQIAYGNRNFYRYFLKQKHFLNIKLLTGKGTDDNGKSPLLASKSQFLDETSGDNEEDDVDLFNLTEDQIKNLEKGLDDNSSGDDGLDSNSNESNDDISNSTQKKRWKSAVDDRFFSLAEMEEYLDNQEKDGVHLEDFFETFDTDADALSNVQDDYHYADFFGSRDNSVKENSSEASSINLEKGRKVLRSNEVSKSVKKRVTFAGEIDNDVDDKNESDGRIDQRVILGQLEEEEEDGTEFQRRQKKLQGRISTIEKANLAPRSWELSGEVTAIEREENTMLEKHIEFDQSAPCAPVITVDLTTELETAIIQRIKDKTYDDVVRTKYKPETSAAYRVPVMEEEVVKKSLAEVYEEQFQKTQCGIGNEEKTNEKHEEIKKLMSSLFQKLNALSHYRYIPPEIRPEVRILGNMSSLQKEEVGPMASTDALLLAPEEIHKHVSGMIKGDDEKTKKDRSRAHRRKKKWQHIRQLEREQIGLVTKAKEIPTKEPNLVSQYDRKGGSVKLTSFFQRLQAKTTEQVESKKHKIIDMNVSKRKLSTNYKL